jgi:predicted phosphodiesterase
MFDHTTIAVIGGNHGENRKEGKAYTTFADNDDVASPEAVKESFDLAGWDMLEWYIPNEELSMCIDLGGVKVAIVHGHQFRGGVNALKKAEDWWRVNDFGLQPVREAQILFSGHLHHYSNTNVTHSRTWMQAPTIDPGSKWYTDTSGVTAIPGVLNLVLTEDHPLGYDHLRVISPRNDMALTS